MKNIICDVLPNGPRGLQINFSIVVTVRDLKEQVAAQANMPAEQLQCRVQGVIKDDNCKIADMDLDSGGIHVHFYRRYQNMDKGNSRV